ncbi:MAG: hypothetical protein HYU68_06180 [Bacteroidetes bacterium]|nr:hypothetical protein [Bacteroidota bacterium]
MQQRIDGQKHGCSENRISLTIEKSKDRGFYQGQYTLNHARKTLVDNTILKINQPWVENQYSVCPYMVFWDKYIKEDEFNLIIPVDYGYKMGSGVWEEKFKLFTFTKDGRNYGQLTVDNVIFELSEMPKRLEIYIEENEQVTDTLQIIKE